MRRTERGRGISIMAGGFLLGWLLRRRPRRVIVAGPSMEPALRDGDRLLVLRGRGPAVGQIVACRDPRAGRRILVKRVVAVDETGISVEGDNRASSTDSRVFGPLARRAVLGRVVYRYAPPERAGPLPPRSPSGP